jgi:hypothetical protein
LAVVVQMQVVQAVSLGVGPLLLLLVKLVQVELV